MNSPKTNLPASVRQRLLNRAREKKLPFQELAQRYAIERFLSRLAQSAHTDFLTPVMAPNHPAHIWTPPGPWNCREGDGVSCPP